MPHQPHQPPVRNATTSPGPTTLPAFRLHGSLLQLGHAFSLLSPALLPLAAGLRLPLSLSPHAPGAGAKGKAPRSASKRRTASPKQRCSAWSSCSCCSCRLATASSPPSDWPPAPVDTALGLPLAARMAGADGGLLLPLRNAGLASAAVAVAVAVAALVGLSAAASCSKPKSSSFSMGGVRSAAGAAVAVENERREGGGRGRERRGMRREGRGMRGEGREKRVGKRRRVCVCVL